MRGGDKIEKHAHLSRLMLQVCGNTVNRIETLALARRFGHLWPDMRADAGVLLFLLGNAVPSTSSG
jgi:hypothetical protein